MMFFQVILLNSFIASSSADNVYFATYGCGTDYYLPTIPIGHQLGFPLNRCVPLTDGSGSYKDVEKTSTPPQKGVPMVSYDSLDYATTDCTGAIIKTNNYDYPTACTATSSEYGAYLTELPTSGGATAATLLKSYTSAGCSTLTSFVVMPSDICFLDYLKMSCSGTTITQTFYLDGEGCTGVGNTTVLENANRCTQYSNAITIAECLAPSTPTQSPTIRAPSSDTTTGNSTTTTTETKTCFAADELVQKEDGTKIRISDVKVGDRVLSASIAGVYSYADVIAVPHRKNDIEATFSVISTASGDLKLTPDHYLMAGVCGSKFNLQRASDVLVGACLMTTSGPAQVIAASAMRGKGVYTIVTTEEFIVVNGIVASPYSLNHYAANGFYNVFRALYSTAPGVMKSGFMGVMYERIGAVFQSSA